jgi:predicted O-linked N-acetylglucosamine transferase (SPINDLY family)
MPRSSAAMLDWEQLPADLDRLRAAAQAAMHTAAAPLTPQVWLDPTALLPLLDDPLLLRWCAELANAQRQGTRPHASRPRPRPRSAPRQGRWRLGVLLGGRGQTQETPVPPALDLFTWFDRTEVELYCYSDAWADLPGTPPRHPRLRAHASAWHDSRHLGTDDLVGVVRGDRLDILLDLSGGGGDTRLDVLAQRPAPVQVAWTRHAGTTGAPWIDYLIGDPVTTPLTRQPEFSECLAQLPQRPPPLHTASPSPVPTRATRAACGLPEHATVLACLTRPERLNLAQFQQWCALLQAQPEAVLWLLAPPEPARQRLLAHLVRAGLAPQRLVFAPWQPPAEHRARLPLADLVLDPCPGNAETAAREALQAGVPVLTQTGRGASTRRTAALLHHLGLPLLVCATPEQVQQTATALLRTPQALAAMRTHLCHTFALAPTDQRRQALDLQHLLWRMLAREDAGLPPAPLAAAPAPRRS